MNPLIKAGTGQACFKYGRKSLLPNPSTNLASDMERSCYMFRKRLIFAAVIITSVVFLLGSASASASSPVLKKESQGSEVTSLQKDLKKLGYLSVEPTGYYGDATFEAVKKLQKEYGYEPDGVAGSITFSLIDRLLGRNVSAKTGTGDEKQASASTTNYKLPWSTASKTFAIGKTATVYDIETGLSFKVKRTYGHNHADCEALTSKDTAMMKKIFGGEWTWDRRAVIITAGDVKIAASMAGMPHAGSDKYAANRYISSRSGGYGRGENLDAVKGNNMSGHFDIHFYKSRTHGTNRTDSKHQSMVNKAAEWAKKNL